MLSLVNILIFKVSPDSLDLAELADVDGDSTDLNSANADFCIIQNSET